jgi:hypothetical protein
LTPGQFWRLTPREFRLVEQGFWRRDDRAWEKLATLGLWVLAPYTKKKLTPAQLLGRYRLVTQPPRPEAPGDRAADAATEAARAHVLAQALQWAQEP